MDTSTARFVPMQPDFPPNAPPDAAVNPPAINPFPSSAQVMPRSVLRWEEQGNFDTLLARISAALQPADMMEGMWTRDVADLVCSQKAQRAIDAKVASVVPPSRAAHVGRAT